MATTKPTARPRKPMLREFDTDALEGNVKTMIAELRLTGLSAYDGNVQCWTSDPRGSDDMRTLRDELVERGYRCSAIG